VYDFTTVSKNHSFILSNGIISHNCLPSRMTLNQIFETVKSKSCVLKGKFGDVTPFGSASMNIAEKLCEELAETGYERHGYETMYNGMTGVPFQAQIFIGPTYYQRLKHMVSNKIHSRANGQVTTLYRQPLDGRSRNGGLRVGEMEKDACLAHGITRFLKERLFEHSDPYRIPICNICGQVATTQTECKSCESNDISSVNMPYSSKILLTEINAMSIKTVITVKK
jgi:DNA-directed RNA polymerase II subunit RPB2